MAIQVSDFKVSLIICQFDHLGISIRDLVEHLDKLFRDDKQSYTKFLACRGASAQWLLDLLQDVSSVTLCK
jgi:hypothetical protein